VERRVTGKYCDQSKLLRSREVKTTSLCKWDNEGRTSPQVERSYYGSIWQNYGSWWTCRCLHNTAGVVHIRWHHLLPCIPNIFESLDLKLVHSPAFKVYRLFRDTSRLFWNTIFYEQASSP